MKKITLFAVSLVAMCSCNKSVIETPVPDSEYGYIEFGISADTEMVETKTATPVSKENSTYLLSLVGTGSNVPFTGKMFKDLTDDDLKVMADTYVFSAQNITEEAAEVGYGALRLYGEHRDLVVTAGGTTPANIACTPANALVTVALDQAFGDTFKEAEVYLKDGSRSLKIETFGHADDGNTKVTKSYFNIDNGTLYWEVKAKVNDETDFKYFRKSFAVAKATHHKITLAAGTNGTITVSITADETITSVEESVTVDPNTPVQNN